MSRVRVSPAAADDARQAALYLRASRVRSAAEFTAAFRRAVADIRANPRTYPVVEDPIPGVEIREYLIAKFHYRVIFTLDGNEAAIVAVFHSSRRPGAWHHRLPPTV
jgi:plasmid stabilization system protein ParE